MTKLLTFLLTIAILYFYGQFVHGLVREGDYFWLLILFLLPFVWARYVSTEWEKEQDDANIRAWLQKWRFRFSRIWPMKGEVLPPNATEIPAPQGVRKLPKSS